ncbi:MAG: DUF6128 domain-containing protein [Wujia sp.]
MGMQQRRWVSYIFRYRNYERCEIAGFIKVQRINIKSTDVTRIRMGLKMYKEYPCVCTAYLLLHGQARPFTTIHFMESERDTILTSVELPWNDPLGDGVAFPEYEGIFFLCDDGEQLAGMWVAEKYDIRQVRLPSKLPVMTVDLPEPELPRMEEEPTEPEAQMPEEELTEQEAEEPVSEEQPVEVEAEETVSENEPVEPEAEAPISEDEWRESEQQMQEEPSEIPQIQIPEESPLFSEEASGKDVCSCSEMLSTYPKLPLFAGSQILDGVKIVPQDIGKLDMANWKLGVNSFLSHGYYKYQYLMLGKIKMNKSEAYVIGVPGVFTNKERYLANMFGFRVFVPVKKTKIMTGNFGYWVSEIVGKN